MLAQLDIMSRGYCGSCGSRLEHPSSEPTLQNNQLTLFENWRPLSGSVISIKRDVKKKAPPSTGGREDFVSRSSPLLCNCVPRFAREGLAGGCLPFLWVHRPVVTTLIES
jgi:hypothetical protein